jgi:hypothetical protein
MATVEFFGQEFTLRPKVSEYALLKFARAARGGQDAETMEGMASMLDLLEKCIVAEQWATFDRLASDNDASAEDVMAVVQAAFSQSAERPTGRLSDSSDGPTSTPLSSASNVSLAATSSRANRPDLALMVSQAV